MTSADLGTVAVCAMDHWLFPLWLRPRQQEQEQAIDFGVQDGGGGVHADRLVTDGQRNQSLTRGTHDR